MNFVKYLTALLARFFLSAIFLVSGTSKIIYWQKTEEEWIKILTDWETALSFSTSVQIGISNLIAWAPLFLILATLLELLGGLFLLFGVRERLGAFLLILFLLPATIIFHQFWFIEGAARDIQIAFFLRNVAILGGLLMVILHGDARRGDSFFSERMEP